MQTDSTIAFFNKALELVLAEPLFVGLSILALLLFIQNLLLSRRVNTLTRGASGQSLEHVIKKTDERVEMLEKYARNSSQKIKNIDERLGSSIRGIATERFDPFQNSGGQQSFVTAFLNEKGDGVVISGIHARDGVRVYAKPVQSFASERELSEEEQTAINQAQKNLVQ